MKKYKVIPGAEPFYWDGNEIGILISHGFMGTPQSVHFLGETLAELGYTVYAPRLKGHGTHEKDLENCRYEEWFDSLEEGYEWLQLRCTEIFVIGQSMGGTLTLHLAHKYPEIKGIMLINTALSVPGFDYLEGQTEPRFVDEPAPDIKEKGVHEITYDKAPLKAIHQLQALMKRTPALLPSITVPALCFKSVEDHVVPAENTDYILEHIGSAKKEMVVLFNSYHVASMDYEKEFIVKRCGQFIQQHTPKAITSSF
ncbi:MAG TPA: alpha/beta fold hydrolase [Bacillus sp. (in: firmicutes)]|nr:alpha/beta fold hydrolase [Bacillus sp. (in: firmicutes)]